MQHKTAREYVPDGGFEGLWGGAGGLQGYFPLTQCVGPQQQKQLQQEDRQQSELESRQQVCIWPKFLCQFSMRHSFGVSFAGPCRYLYSACFVLLFHQRTFFLLASLFFEEREVQQMEQLQRPLREYVHYVPVHPCFIKCVSSFR